MFDQNDQNQATATAGTAPVADTSSALPLSPASATPTMDPGAPQASAPVDLSAPAVDASGMMPSSDGIGLSDPNSSTDAFNTTTMPAPAMDQPAAPLADPVDQPTVAADPAPAMDFSTSTAQATPTMDATAPQASAPVDLSAPAVDASGMMPSSDVSAPASDASGDLLSLKQQALQNLTPLLDKLDQSPEEKFRTTMMMIQASDDQSLVQAAYDAANAIPDEKAKAQALLDVVNEINYFTQSKPQPGSSPS